MNAMTEAKNLEINAIGGLSASAILIDLNISVWVGRKTDRKNQQKIIDESGAANADAAHVTKKLFVGNPKIEEIMKKANAARSYVSDRTLPWMGDLKLLPVAAYLKVTEDLNALKDDFDRAVVDFLADYDIAVSAQAFKLGALFDRTQYPTVDELRNKFSMSWSVMPLPQNDFRVEAENVLKKEMHEAYNKAMNERIEGSMKLMWSRLKECLDHMIERLDKNEDGKNKIFRDTMLENVKDVVNLLRDFNLTNDPDMEMARLQLHALLDHVEPDELRKNDAVRHEVKTNVSAVLDKLAFKFDD